MCTCVCMFTYTCTYGQKHIHMCKKHMKIFIYVCIWTHLLCICQQMHLGTCDYVNVDMCINIACVHSYALMLVSKTIFVHMHVHIFMHISHAHMYIYASIYVYFNVSKSLHITYANIQIYTWINTIHVYRHMYFYVDMWQYFGV